MNRARLIVPLLALLLLGAEPATRPADDPTVFVTKSGKSYHRETCSSLSKSKIAVKKSDAEKRGFSPCKRCKP